MIFTSKIVALLIVIFTFTSFSSARTIGGTILVADSHFDNSHAGSMFDLTYDYMCMYGTCMDDTCNNVNVVFTGNTFTKNIATSKILEFENWAYLEIGNSLFSSNTVGESVLSIRGTTDSCSSMFSPTINISIHDVCFLKNSQKPLTTADKGAVMVLKYYDAPYQDNTAMLLLSNITFNENTGTPLSIHEVFYPHITGNMYYKNNAITGGGMYLDNIVYIASDAAIVFEGNIARYGGAIYAVGDICHPHDDDYHDKSFSFSGNRASFGSQIYMPIYTDDDCFLYKECEANLPSNITIDTTPSSISFNATSVHVFPGQAIEGIVEVHDCYGRPSSCTADVELHCDGQICADYDIVGPTTLFLVSGSVNTQIRLKLSDTKRNKGMKNGSCGSNPDDNHVSINPQLKFICKAPIEEFEMDDLAVLIDITVHKCCPLGLSFQNTPGLCECNKVTDSNFICSNDTGIVCIKKGYWYTNDNNTTNIWECINSFCNYSRPLCPPSVTIGYNFLLLGESQDDQCLDGHGGILCTGCADGKQPTYGALQCTDSSTCANWHPIILLLLNIVIPFIVGVCLITLVRLKLSIGSGYLYGPLFYLAVLNLIPLTSYTILNRIASSFVATLLLQFQVLGYLPWCFLSLSPLANKWFEFLAPSVVAVVLLLTVYLARRSPQLFERIQKSPLQAMCLLMLVTFWSVASTAISIIIPVHLSGEEGSTYYRIRLQPDKEYLKELNYILLWTISVIILLVLFSIILILLFLRFLNLHRLKPVLQLDEFQSCYRDSYRWYGGVYFAVWTILQALVISSANYEIFQTVIITLTATHCLLQPYCSKWLNMMDGLFLSCLTVTSCLVLDETGQRSNISTVNEILVYASVMGPLIGIISVGIVSIVLVRFGLMPKLINAVQTCTSCTSINTFITRCKNRVETNDTPEQTRITRTVIGIRNSPVEREPLLQYLQENQESRV